MRARIRLLSCSLVFVGCGDPNPSTSTDTSSGGDETETGADTDTGGAGGDEACDTLAVGGYEVFEEDDQEISAAEVASLCGDLTAIWPTMTNAPIPLLIRRPKQPGTNSEWPSVPIPLIVFTHGNGGQNGAQYEHIWEEIVPHGVAVASVDNNTNGSPERRAADLVCVTRWMASQWDSSDRLGCGFAVWGHSNGGEGAHIAAKWILENGLGVGSLSLQQVLGLAPRWVEDSHVQFSDGTGQIDEPGVPTCLIHGSIDNDVPGGAITNYERTRPEVGHSGGGNEKILIWAYDVPHNVLGGGAATDFGHKGLSSTQYLAKGREIAAAYASQCVRRQLFGELEATAPFVYGESFPGLVGTQQWWDYLPNNTGKRTLVFTSFEPPGQPQGGSKREIVDTFDRPTGGGFGPSASSGLIATSIEPQTFAGNVSVGVIAGLASFALSQEQAPPNNVARVDWAADESGTLRWSSVDALDLAGVRYLSFRAGSVADVDQDSCTAIGPVREEISFSIGVWKNDVEVVFFELEGLVYLPAQDFLEVPNANAPGTTRCSVSQFMRTVRIPLDGVCQDFAPEEITAVTLRFGDGAAGSVLIDSLEFHRSLDGGAACPK